VTHARKRGIGMWAWILHRVSAMIILLSVLLHVLRNQFGFITPGGKLVTIDLLVFSLAYHSLNGLRVILIESSGWAAKHEDTLFWAVVTATFVLIFTWILTVGL
jgi:succinate dehydrogenase / fumarate reductase cytochrome b subunit